VNGELAILYQVQQLDGELARRKVALAGLDTGAELKAEIAAGEAALTDLQRRHHESERQAREVELETRTLEGKRDRYDAQLNSGAVRNPRQLEDLQKEVAMLRREISKLDDRMLSLMDAMEGERAETEAREADLAGKRDRLTAVLATHESESARLNSEMAALQQERDQTAARVDANLLRRYEQIRARGGNVGIVKVTGDVCPGCHLTLASELLKELRTGRIGLTCDNCGRLLYMERPEEES
jgi:predicted  nucleic acid-binding Zn-ribbon protein